MHDYHSEKSLGLVPIAIAVAIAFAAGFGVLYAMFGHSASVTGVM